MSGGGRGGAGSGPTEQVAVGRVGACGCGAARKGGQGEGGGPMCPAGRAGYVVGWEQEGNCEERPVSRGGDCISGSGGRCKSVGERGEPERFIISRGGEISIK
ncbi:MAG: hypothetical protein CVV32_12685 [Methanomicrobiales archaeon HGW-Methanomicrobiales-3]|nr:MAG: hypothetical protein CVV32_12685 [Methanomicrobiales archaeon HGW-Methanomicrobiales-3]